VLCRPARLSAESKGPAPDSSIWDGTVEATSRMRLHSPALHGLRQTRAPAPLGCLAGCQGCLLWASASNLPPATPWRWVAPTARRTHTTTPDTGCCLSAAGACTAATPTSTWPGPSRTWSTPGAQPNGSRPHLAAPLTLRGSRPGPGGQTVAGSLPPGHLAGPGGRGARRRRAYISETGRQNNVEINLYISSYLSPKIN
jgi:hypothetical protein